MSVECLFLGNCQISRMAQIYGTVTPHSQKRSTLFRSTTPHFGEYHEDESKSLLETASVAIVQLITTDYVFNRENVLAMRGDKPTIFVPYVYLPGFRRLEKLSSKGKPFVDGASYLTDEMDRVGPSRGAINYMRGQVDARNLTRLQASFDEMRRREAQGADVKIADYVAQTYQDWMPCYAINHPAPHVLFEMYNQIAKLAGFASVSEHALTPYDIGRATLPHGTGGLTPYCVEALGLQYQPETHWFSHSNKIAQEIARRWQKANGSLKV